MKNRSPDINFIKGHKIVQQKKAKKEHLLHILSLVILGLYGVAVLTIFIFTTFLGIRITETQDTLDSQKKKLDSLAPIETKFISIKDKAKAVLTLNKNSEKYHELSQLVFELIPQGMNVTGFTIDEKGEISFSGSTADPLVLDQYFGNVKRLEVSNEVKVEKANVSGVSINNEGLYTFNNKLKIGL